MGENVVALGNAVTGNARKAQMVEHFARKLDKLLMHGVTDLSVAFVIYGHAPKEIMTSVNWDTSEGAGIPVRMFLTDAAALLHGDASRMRGAQAEDEQ